MRSRSRSALALILVVGVLGVMAVLGSAFAVLSRLERRAAQQRMNATRAFLLARSGIEDAAARLEAGQDPDSEANRYGGENWDATSDLLLSDFEALQETYLRTGAGTKADVENCPARAAMRPSYPARAFPSPNPALITVDGRRRGYSGRLSDDRSPLGNTYALKVMPLSGINVNGGDPSVFRDGLGQGYCNDILRNLLGRLAAAVGGPVTTADGTNLISMRPRTSRGWKDWAQIRDVALGKSQAKLDALRPYLTLHTWSDKRVVVPQAPMGNCTPEASPYVPGTGGMSYLCTADVLLGRPVPGGLGTDMANDSEATKASNCGPDFVRWPGQYDLRIGQPRIAGRSPVNLAWARHRKPVLVALMTGLQARYLDEIGTGANGLGHPTEFGKGNGSTPANLGGTIGSNKLAKLSPAEVDWIADRLVAYAAPFRTWQDWDTFCQGLGPPGLAGQPGPTGQPGDDQARRDQEIQAKRDLLKAHFNPNTDLNKFNPNTSLWRSVDKSDLIGYPLYKAACSTEFSLIPVHDHEVTSAGRVLAPDGRVLAVRTLTATLGGPSVVRLSTQKEFVCEDLGNLDVPGDESRFRTPGEFSAPNAAAGTWTWGARQGYGAQGVSLQTYPEPCTNIGGNGLFIRPADFDGSVQLATLETRPDQFYGVPAATRTLKMLAAFDDNMNLDEGAGDRTCQGNYHFWPNNIGSSGEAVRGADYSVWHMLVQNTLYPDGAYSEHYRVPNYFSSGNADGFHGVISTWVKPHYSAPIWRGYQIAQWTNYSTKTPGTLTASSTSQFFALGFMAQDWEKADRRMCLFFESSHRDVDDNAEGEIEHGIATPVRGTEPHRWKLVTAMYDFRDPSPTGADGRRLIVDDGTGESDQGMEGQGHINYNGPAREARAQDITLPDVYGPHRIFLGRAQWVPVQSTPNGPWATTREWEYFMALKVGTGGEFTLDEFAIYDFGGAEPTGTTEISPVPADTLASPAILALNRFREGRYYKESAYPETNGLTTPRGFPLRTAAEYLSAPIALGPARIQALSWTPVVPPELPNGAISFELANAAGTDYLKDASGVPVSGRFTNPLLSPVGKRVNAPFRLHAVFQPNLADPDNTPILDPLALDDVTVLYRPAGSLGLLNWGEGE